MVGVGLSLGPMAGWISKSREKLDGVGEKRKKIYKIGTAG